MKTKKKRHSRRVRYFERNHNGRGFLCTLSCGHVVQVMKEGGFPPQSVKSCAECAQESRSGAART